MTKRSVTLAWALAAAVLLAGCLGAADEPVAGASEAGDDGVADAVEGAWNLTGAATMGWTAAVGSYEAAYAGVYDPNTCPWSIFRVPPNATGLAIRVDAAPVSPAHPGVGLFKVEVTSPDGESAFLDYGAGEMAFEADAPAEGPWSVSMHPAAVDVNQYWDVTVDVAGAGAAPGEWGGVRADCN